MQLSNRILKFNVSRLITEEAKLRMIQVDDPSTSHKKNVQTFSQKLQNQSTEQKYVYLPKFKSAEISASFNESKATFCKKAHMTKAPNHIVAHK